VKLGVVLRADRLIRQESFRQRRVVTPYGAVDRIFSGELSGVPTHFLYGRFDAERTPSWQIPYQANQAAMDELGVDHVLGTFVVGGVDKRIRGGDLIVPHDLIGLTGPRVSLPPVDGRFSNAHVVPSLCPRLRRLLITGAQESGIPVHEDGVYFSFFGFARVETLAELELLDRLGMSIVGQTMDPELTLARLRRRHYAAICVAIDSYYDMRDELKQDPDEFRARSRAAIRAGRERFETILQAGVAAMAGAPAEPDCGCVRVHKRRQPDMFASFPEANW
jgi:5'-methylthioadenosine phosphorylase